MKSKSKHSKQQIANTIAYYQRLLNEAEDKKDTHSNESADVKDQKGKIISGLEGMKPGAVMQAISKSLGKTTPEFLKTHLIDILINAAKNGKDKLDK